MAWKVVAPSTRIAGVVTTAPPIPNIRTTRRREIRPPR